MKTKAEIIQETVVKPVIEDRVVLTMTMETAEILKKLVGGHVIGKGNIRQATSSIYSALDSVNINRVEKPLFTGYVSCVERN